MKETKLNLFKAILELSKKSPEIYYVLEKTEIIPTDKVPSAGARITANGFQILINDVWAKTFSAKDLSAVLEHEILHILFAHCEEMQTIEHKRIYNVAADAVINELSEGLRDKTKVCKELQGGVFIGDLSKQIGVPLSSSTHTVAQIYEILVEKAEKIKSECFDLGIMDKEEKGDSGGGGSGQESDGEAIDPSAVEMGKEVEEALKKLVGKGSLDAKILLGRGRDRDLERIFKNSVSKFLCSHKRDMEPTKRRPNRRSIPLASGKIRVEKQKILIGLDVSGSMMDEKTLKRLGSVLETGIRMDYEVDCIWGDTERLGYEKNLDRKFDFSKITGGGCTSLGFMFETKGKYDVVVMVTDGYFNHDEIPKNMKSKTLVLLTEDGEVKGVKNVRI